MSGFFKLHGGEKMTQNDYINETIRFCQNLTQLKYDEHNDKVVKGFVRENLEKIDIDFTLQESSTKKGCIRKILSLATILCTCEKDSEDDKKTKQEMAKALAELSKVSARVSEERKEKRADSKLTKMLAAM